MEFSVLSPNVPWEVEDIWRTFAAYFFVLHIPFSFGGLGVVAQLLHCPSLDPLTTVSTTVVLQLTELTLALALLQHTTKNDHKVWSFFAGKLCPQQNWIKETVLGFIFLMTMVSFTTVVADKLIGLEDTYDPMLRKILSDSPTSRLLCVFLYCVIAPLSEETIYRGFLVTALSSSLKWKDAVIISSLMFSIAHFSINSSFQLFVIGCITGLAYCRTAKRKTVKLIPFNKLREYLQDKRYLLVIDDIWDAQTWRIIECALVKNNQGSRVTTTRISDIATSCCCSYGDQVYEMKTLSATDSKRLLFRRTFSSDERCPPQLKEAANDILRKCGGLPLAIISISSLLATKPKSIGHWGMVKSRINYKQENSPDIELMTWVLSLSYFDLPRHLQTCLMYLSIFPEDYVTKKDRLVGRWIAEGFINAKQGKSLLEIGDNYFNDLINRSLVQPVDEDDGQAQACSRVHDTILDFLVSRSNEENFLTLVGGSNLIYTPVGKIRRVSFHKNSEGSVSPG
uniref:Uncharacterized protein n=1 Tax=Oryza brachyantha TaxID=4533 RepID=J3MKK0_ORYBR